MQTPSVIVEVSSRDHKIYAYSGISNKNFSTYFELVNSKSKFVIMFEQWLVNMEWMLAWLLQSVKSPPSLSFLLHQQREWNSC